MRSLADALRPAWLNRSDSTPGPGDSGRSIHPLQAGSVVDLFILNENFQESDTPSQEYVDTWWNTLDAVEDKKSPIAMQAFRRFHRLSGRAGLFPTPWIIKHKISLDPRTPLHTTGISDVYRGKRQGQRFALKSLRLSGNDQMVVRKAFIFEAWKWKKLDHDNIVPFIGMSTFSPMCLVSMWMDGGTIIEHLKKNPQTHRGDLLRDVVAGLMFIHSHELVHGDIKGANILVDAQGHARITDFGISTILHGTQTGTDHNKGAGSMRWQAPEFHDDEIINFKIDIPIDVYSLAITFWEVFSLRVPFDHLLPMREHAVANHVSRGGRPPALEDAAALGMTDAVWEVMQQGWHHNPSERPPMESFQRALNTS